MKISVVMTTYNGEKYLKEQIDSILLQTLLPDEIIICDDASTDGTVAILEQYKDVRGLRYVINQKQIGLIRNFKKAVSLAKEENHVALCDQDDIWLPDKLLCSVQELQMMDQSVPCMVHSDLIWIDEYENILNHSFQNERRQSDYEHNLNTLLFANFVTGCTVMMNPTLRRLFEEMPDDIKFHDAWIALAASVFGLIVEVPDPTVRYRMHGMNLSISASNKPRSRYRIIFDEVIKSLLGKDDFLELQLQTARRFYDQYSNVMDFDIRRCFEQFLLLEHKSYFYKKLAYRSIVRKFRIGRH